MACMGEQPAYVVDQGKTAAASAWLSDPPALTISNLQAVRSKPCIWVSCSVSHVQDMHWRMHYDVCGSQQRAYVQGMTGQSALACQVRCHEGKPALLSTHCLHFV